MRRAIFLVLVTVMACSSEQATTRAGIARDSAGIRIVEHEEPDWSTASWAIADTPTIRIGTVEGEEPYQLFQVSAALRATDRRIYILNASTAEVRVFDPSGDFLTAIGRKGAGPGEFRYPVRMWLLPGDSLMVWDAPLGPRTVFAPDGSVARVTPVDRTRLMAQLGEGRATEGVVPLSDGGMIAAAWRVGQERDVPNNELFRPPFDMTLVAADLDSSVSLGTYGGIEQMFIPAGERRTAVTQLFSPHFQLAVGENPVRIALGNGDRYDLRVYDGAGELRLIIRRTTLPGAITAADRDSALSERLAWAEQRGQRQEAERRLAELPQQQHFPAHGLLMVDSEGNVWVQEFRKPTELQARWTIYDEYGNLAGTLETNRDLRLMEIGRDYILAIETDANDVERVSLYSLSKGT